MLVHGDAAAESTEDNHVEDLIRDEDNEGTSEDNPAKGEEDRSNQVEELVTEGVRLSINKLDLEDLNKI